MSGKAKVISFPMRAQVPQALSREQANAEDAELLAQLRQGDHAAFAALVGRHAERFYRVAYRFIPHAAEVEDIVQEAFVKLWEKPGMWQPGQAAFTTWFHRVVVNLCLDRQKKKRPVALIDDSWIRDERESAEEALMERQRRQSLETRIAALPERQRVALNLCFYEGLSNQEAAVVMGVRLKALQSLLMRAKTTLRETLKDS